MELLHRYSGLKQWVIRERFGDLVEELMSRDRRVIREKLESEPKIRKWFHDLMPVLKSRFDPQLSLLFNPFLARRRLLTVCLI